MLLRQHRFCLVKNSNVLQPAESVENTKWNKRFFIFFINDESDKHGSEELTLGRITPRSAVAVSDRFEAQG
jgi:hypothetical protein